MIQFVYEVDHLLMTALVGLRARQHPLIALVQLILPFRDVIETAITPLLQLVDVRLQGFGMLQDAHVNTAMAMEGLTPSVFIALRES